MKMLADLPKDKDLIVLNHDGSGGLRGYFLNSKNENEALCGIRGSVIIALKELDDQYVRENLYPLFVAGLDIKKLQKIGHREYVKDRRIINDFAEQEYTI